MRALLYLAAPALALTRLEPRDGAILHGGGEYPGNFETYSAFLGARGPSVKMLYFGDWPALNSTPPGAVNSWFAAAAAALDGDAAPDGAFVVVQLGLQLPLNGGEAAVASGALDAAVRALTAGLRALARPVFLRVGYEFNGPWNGYRAPSYIGAYRRIAAAVRADDVLNATVALVWDGSCDAAVDPTPFWPGADVVDWQGVNIFSGASAPAAPAGSCLWFWLNTSTFDGIPLMIGEATPRGLNVSDPAAGAWRAWYAPLLALLDAFPRVKLLSYIDMDWEATDNGRWKGWGDSRVEVALASGVAAAWQAELERARWVNRLGRDAMLAALGLPLA